MTIRAPSGQQPHAAGFTLGLEAAAVMLHFVPAILDRTELGDGGGEAWFNEAGKLLPSTLTIGYAALRRPVA